MTNKLEIVKFKGKEYFLDDRLRQMREVNNPHATIHYHNIEVCGNCDTFFDIREHNIVENYDYTRDCPECGSYLSTLESAQEL